MTAQVVCGRVVMERYGPPEVLELREVALDPVPPGEVRLRTIAAAVNRADVEIRNGTWPVQLESPFPYTPGLETLGSVVEVGDGVDGLRPGDRAITMMQRLGGIHGTRPGGYSELVTVPATSVAVVPDDLDPLAVAACGLAAVTALEGLRRLGPLAGRRVCVLGANGGVGSAAVSWAVRAGAHAVAVVGRADVVGYVRSLGAAEVLVLDRARPLTDVLAPRSVDAVLETLGARTFADSVAALRPGGRLCLVGAASGPDLHLSAWDLMQELRLTGWSSENLTGDDLRADIEELTDALRTGTLPPPGVRVMPLREAAAAHRLLESGGVTGRLLLVPD